MILELRSMVTYTSMHRDLSSPVQYLVTVITVSPKLLDILDDMK